MKKTLIAVAALTAAVGAMAADLKITGEVDTTVRMSDDGANSTTNVGRDGKGTTNVTFQGSEDLGDGLKAIFLYEYDFDPFVSAIGGSGGGEKFAGLQGGFGTLRLGTPNGVTHNVQALRNGMFGTKDGGRATAGGLTSGGGDSSKVSGGAATLYGIADTRYDGSIRYDSPSFGGLTVAVAFAPATEKTANDGTGSKDGQKVGAKTDIGLFFKNGPLSAGVGYNVRGEDEAGFAKAGVDYENSLQNLAAFNTYLTAVVATAERKTVTVGAQYDLGVAIIGAGYHQLKYDGEDYNSGFNVHVTAPLSDALKLGVNYQSLKYEEELYGVDRTQLAFGVDYALSKTTAIYARYVALSYDEKIAVTANKDNDKVTTALFGLSVKF